MSGSIEQIKAVVCRHFGVTQEQMQSTCRARWIARPRQVAMSLIHEQARYSLPRIGRHFSRDHTTVIHAIRRISKLEREVPAFARQIHEIRARLNYQMPLRASYAAFEHARAMSILALESLPNDPVCY